MPPDNSGLPLIALIAHALTRYIRLERILNCP
jgi:hypothetical protein